MKVLCHQSITNHQGSIVGDSVILVAGFQTTLWWFITRFMHPVHLYKLQNILVHQFANCLHQEVSECGGIRFCRHSNPSRFTIQWIHVQMYHCSSNDVSFCYECVEVLHCAYIVFDSLGYIGAPDNVLQVLEGPLIAERFLIVQPVPYHLWKWKSYSW